jgi:hypothetical protein
VVYNTQNHWVYGLHPLSGTTDKVHEPSDPEEHTGVHTDMVLLMSLNTNWSIKPHLGTYVVFLGAVL